MKYRFEADNHVGACVLLLFNGLGSTNLILVCSRLLLYINGARTGVIAGAAAVYMSIE